eukprot:gene9833-7717_t
MAKDLGLSAAYMGHVQSAMLVGSLLGQLPAGYLSDKYGGKVDLSLPAAHMGRVQAAMLLGYLSGQLPAGYLSEKVLLLGLLLWSLSLALTAGVMHGANPVSALLGCRLFFGLCSSGIMPAVSAMAAKWVPPETKASTIAAIYSCFNIVAVGGLMWSIAGQYFVSKAALEAAVRSHTRINNTTSATAPDVTATTAPHVAQVQEEQQEQVEAEVPAPYGRPVGSSPSQPTNPQKRLLHLSILCWSHAVIGWGFFIMQSWLPMYMQSLGVASLAGAGALSCLPWLAAAFVGAWSGQAADR